MQELKYWKDKIKKRRMNTPWRDFVKEIGSWFPLMLYKNQDMISVFPDSGREGNLTDNKTYVEKYENTLYDDIAYN